MNASFFYPPQKCALDGNASLDGFILISSECKKAIADKKMTFRERWPEWWRVGVVAGHAERSPSQEPVNHHYLYRYSFLHSGEN
jgi:hypothetical protein